MTDLLEAQRLSVWYGRARVLFDIDLRVGPGEVVALLGRNGAGKSTTLAALMGLMSRVSGDVRLNGESISGLPTHRIARLGMGYVPEDRRVFADLTVDENLAVGRRPPRPGVPHWTPDMLFALFPNLAELRRRRAGQMSGGEQQMLTIARTLMGNPALVLLDEPSEGLAPRIVDQMAEALGAMKTQGLALLLSEQNSRFARSLTDRVTVIDRGRVRFHGTMAELDSRSDIRDSALCV
ncbi:ABC transporter ATP-binding protein [Rhodospira trueperi]|uniref:Branched-chain amino acid transport system ATP-binding protein n=1 Tax=Rhodospira trueperi TaxID=69960 RepID=A0A1G6XPF2_9PROT|nr:branched-chain amino acid transport system ATP-binding protein [Rhodospira trueperi]